MNVTAMLQFADRLLFTHTGKHLDDLQKTVITGVYEGKTYETIANECNRSESRVRSVGRKLWQIFSEELGEDIKKSNFVSTIERLQIKYSPSSQIVGINHNLNFCTQNFNQSNHHKISDHINTQSKSLIQDLTLAPQIIHFYSRESELKTLDRWIFTQNARLISVLGLSGLGKTTLVKRFVDRTLDRFEVIIWRNLKFPEPLDSLVNDLLQICHQEPKETIRDRLKQLFALFAEKRCLIILDDVQNLFVPGEFAGQYQPEYQDYQNFFQEIAELDHQSHLILVSQEKCAEMECLDEELYPIKSLALSGLDDIEILNHTGLQDKDSWLQLINLYQGNPVYLKSMAIFIENIFDGHVAEFLAENSLVIPQDIQVDFHQLFNRLSPVERQLVLKLSKLAPGETRKKLIASLDLSSIDLMNGLQSLQKRYLVTKIKGDRILFQLSPVFREYVSRS